MCDDLLHLWKLIEQRQEFTNEDIDKLHILCNKLVMCQWMDLLDTAHMTNYLHIIGPAILLFLLQSTETCTVIHSRDGSH
jgi:hypothetical protein